MSNERKAKVSFSNPQHDFHPGHHDEAASYFDYLLELADLLFYGNSGGEDECPC
jgi:hypothetical protein